MRRDRLLIRRIGKYIYYNRDKLSVNFVNDYALTGTKIFDSSYKEWQLSDESRT